MSSVPRGFTPQTTPVRRGYVVGRVAGIELAVHPSWLVTFSALALLTRFQILPTIAPHYGAAAAWAAALALALAFSASIVVHEICHSLVARLHGLDARRITLFLFGGLSQVGREPPGPAAEFRIAIAGPLASILISGTFAAAARILHPGHEGLPGMLGVIAWVNWALAVFNLVPGFPLDGGRILRSALWAALRDRARATRLASYGGRAFALVLMGMGVAFLFADIQGGAVDVYGPYYVLLGWFLFGAVGNAARIEGGAHPGDAPANGVRAVEQAVTLGSDEGHAPQPDARRGGGRSAPRARPARETAAQPRDRARHPGRRAPAQRGGARARGRR